MAKITVVMHYTERAKEHIIDPAFRREGLFAKKSVTWDDIQYWVAEGNEVSIRPATAEEAAKYAETMRVMREQ
jgi:hypothetical protein